MTAVVPTRMGVDPDAIAAQYGFDEVRVVRILDGGMFASPVLLRTERGTFVCRIHSFRGTRGAFRYQAESIESASSGGVLCARVQRTRSGGWCAIEADTRRIMALHEYVEGRIVNWIDWHVRKQNGSGFLYELGRRVAELHNSLALVKPGGDPDLDIGLPPIQFKYVNQIRAAWRSELEKLGDNELFNAQAARDRLLTFAPSIEAHWDALVTNLTKWQVDSIPRQIVHGDISPVNIVFDAADEPWFIDWDCVHLGHRVYDAVGDVLNRRPDATGVENRFSGEEVSEYLDGYESRVANPLTVAERQLIPAFCLARQLEDLRQRLFALPTLDPSLDTAYSRLIELRVDMMHQIELN